MRLWLLHSAVTKLQIFDESASSGLALTKGEGYLMFDSEMGPLIRHKDWEKAS